MTIKDRFGLPTDKGMDYIGFFSMVLVIADSLDTDWKQYLTIAATVGISLTAFLTRGSGLSHEEASQIKEAVPTEAEPRSQAPYTSPIKDLLDEAMDTSPPAQTKRRKK